MKIKSFGFILLIALITVALGGCGCFQQQMKGETDAPKGPAAVVAPEAKPVIPVAQGTSPESVVIMKSINFDFDKYNIRKNDAAILKENAAWFAANPGKKVKVEGHCDERGTVEYNLALGQKRADSAKNFLVNLGIDGRSIDTVSYGKEKPLDPGHNEAAWAKNRRAQFVLAQ